MRQSKKEARLSLYNHGNNRCPICLSTFTERDVEEGIVVTLKHVPPKSVAPKASLGMCLTCADCNNRSGRGIDQAAAMLLKPPKARIDVRGAPYTAYIKNDGKSRSRAAGSYTTISSLRLLKQKRQ